MKVFVKIASQGSSNPIEHVIKLICGSNPAFQIVETAEEAELILTNEPRKALTLLKEYEEVKLLITTYEKSERVAALALVKSFKGRVFEKTMLPFIFGEDENLGLAPFLSTYKEGDLV